MSRDPQPGLDRAARNHMLIPRGLLADPAGSLPAASGGREVDVLVVGSGVAGLSAALAVPPGRTVLLATKDRLGHSATRYAQGGIAAVLDLVGDSVAEHVADTLAAGAGLCDPVAVQLLVEEGGQAIADLRARGVGFDPDPSRPRGAGPDPGGRALALAGRPRRRRRHRGRAGAGPDRGGPGHPVRPQRRARLPGRPPDHRRAGHRGPALDRRPPPLVRAGAVVLASGGAGQLFADTTNPPLSTGDGIAAALRAGPVLADMEFVQFHPTALHLPGVPRPSSPRPCAGEGAVLRDGDRDTGHGRRPPPRRPGPPRRRHPGRRRPHGRHRGQAPLARRAPRSRPTTWSAASRPSWPTAAPPASTLTASRSRSRPPPTT